MDPIRPPACRSCVQRACACGGVPLAPSWPSSAVRAAAAARSASGDKAPSAPRTAHRTPRAETGQQPLIDRRHAWRRPVRTCVRVTHARLGRMSRARTAHGRAGGNDARAACSLDDA
jgi:hypothetical protein